MKLDLQKNINKQHLYQEWSEPRMKAWMAHNHISLLDLHSSDYKEDKYHQE